MRDRERNSANVRAAFFIFRNSFRSSSRPALRKHEVEQAEVARSADRAISLWPAGKAVRPGAIPPARPDHARQAQLSGMRGASIRVRIRIANGRVDPLVTCLPTLSSMA
jgi:hypothetical protein